jgi:hypothetical protein
MTVQPLHMEERTMRELTTAEITGVAGGGERTANASMAIMQETPNVGLWLGLTGLSLTGAFGAAFAIAVGGVTAFHMDFGQNTTRAGC